MSTMRIFLFRMLIPMGNGKHLPYSPTNYIFQVVLKTLPALPLHPMVIRCSFITMDIYGNLTFRMVHGQNLQKWAETSSKYTGIFHRYLFLSMVKNFFW